MAPLTVTLRLVLAILLTTASLSNAIRLLNVQEGDYSGISPTCLAVLNQDVACDPLLASASRVSLSGIHHYYDSAELTTLCVDSCSRALATWSRRVAGACQGTRVPTPYNTLVLVEAWAEKFVETYSSICLRDKSGNLCNTVLGKLAGVDPFNQRNTASPDLAFTCHTCLLSLMQTQLAMPLASLSQIKTAFTGLTAKCQATQFSLPPEPSATWEIPATGTLSSASATPTPCRGSVYQVSSSDTCQTISTSKNISTLRLLLANNLEAFCHNFPTSGSLCIPSDWVCTPYTVKKGDTCDSIASSSKQSWVQIVSWNSELGRSCANISRWVGYVICVSTPGGDWVHPNPTIKPAVTSTEDPNRFSPPDGVTPIDQLPIPTRAGWNDTDKYVIDWAPGTRQDCVAYDVAPVRTNRSASSASFRCVDMATQYGAKLEDFLSWNPSLNAGSSCTLQSNQNYCVLLFEKQPKDTTEYCVRYAMTSPGDSCDFFRSQYGLSLDEFTAWNPSVGDQCQSFDLGSTYCVRVRHFRQPGIVASCNKFVMCNVTNHAQDPCGRIENEYGVGHPRFVAWNPAVKNDCSGIRLDYDYCVSIPNYRPTFSATSGIATPKAT